ncbi:MAG: CRISPR system precrRNA processing endoribonuclease RAMP protein Cas6 [Syntrophobacterales bacterium]|nr:CRISPR system precrRNA processing endoribonuclease RAMP protein Cas6 [Syntrophobacterales bacterium]
MLYGRYTFSLAFTDDAILPEYKGSTFRGIFGHSLKKVVCALKLQGCADCLLKEKCVYFRIFELPAGDLTADRAPSDDTHFASKNRIAAPPHPYVIEPPDESRTKYAGGEEINFTLLLFGQANEDLPYFIYAFREMGSIGVGKAVNGKRASFDLKRVAAGERVIYESGGKMIHAGPFAEELSVGAPTPASKITLRLATPLRLKFENNLKAELPFHVLVRAMLRRISSLENSHGAWEPPLDYRGLVARAQLVATESSPVKWFDWKRYSNRQDQAMLMGGMSGDVCYSGDLSEFIPLIRFCEKTHLGKQTTFGLGKIALLPFVEGAL